MTDKARDYQTQTELMAKDGCSNPPNRDPWIKGFRSALGYTTEYYAEEIRIGQEVLAAMAAGGSADMRIESMERIAQRLSDDGPAGAAPDDVIKALRLGSESIRTLKAAVASAGIEAIAKQRRRQGQHHTDEADDNLRAGQLADRAKIRLEHALLKRRGTHAYATFLAKAGALIAAELDRLARAGINAE